MQEAFLHGSCGVGWSEDKSPGTLREGETGWEEMGPEVKGGDGKDHVA